MSQKSKLETISTSRINQNVHNNRIVHAELLQMSSKRALLLSFVLSPLEHGCHQGGSSSGPVFGQHQVKLVVDAHQLADPALHHVLEVRVVPAIKQFVYLVLDKGFLGVLVHLNREPSMAMTTSL